MSNSVVPESRLTQEGDGLRESVIRPAWPALHGGILLLAFVLATIYFSTLNWPWLLLVPIAIYLSVAMLIPKLRRTIPWPTIGRLDTPGVLAAVVLSASTAAVLLTFQSLANPDVSVLANALPVSSFDSILLAGFCIAVVNAVLEELIFRGFLYAIVAVDWGDGVAVAVTAICFGICHFYGYPPGPLGVLLAGLYGVALGLLRWWTGGLGLTIACHITADITIFSILESAGAFSIDP
jgi:uncharacterized protein